MTIYEPAGVTVQANTKLAFVTAIANPAAPSIATEINATSSVEGTLAIRGWAPSLTPNTGNAPARLGTALQLPVEGNIPMSPIAIAYPHNPSLALSDAANKIKALLVRNTVLYVVVRKGVDIVTDWTAGDLVDVWQVRAGFQNDDSTTAGQGAGGGGTDEFAEYEVAQNLFPLVQKVPGVLAA